MIIFFLNNLQIYKVFGIIEESFEEMFAFTLIKKEFGQEETMKQSCEERQARLLLRWKRMSRNKWDKREEVVPKGNRHNHTYNFAANSLEI